MIRELHSKRGVTLLKLMIVLLFIGTIAGCSNPTGTNPGSSNTTARNFLVVTKQWEAKKILQQIYTMEIAYRQEKGTYWPPGATATAIHGGSFADIDVEIMPCARYTYNITGSWDSFAAVAACGTLDDDPTYDVWQITDFGELAVLTDDAAD